MKYKILLLISFVAIKARAETAEKNLVYWKSILLPTKNLSCSIDITQTVERGLDISKTPIKMKEKVKINFLTNEFYSSKLYLFEEGLRNYTHSWDGQTYIQSDRIKRGGNNLSYDLISAPGSVNIYNKRIGSLPEISKVWIDFNVPYLSTVVENSDILVFKNDGKKLLVGELISIDLGDDGKSIKKIDRYIKRGEKRELYSSVEISKNVTVNKKIMPADLKISIFLEDKLITVKEYTIFYDETSFDDIDSKDIGYKLPDGVFVNNLATGKQYQKGKAIPDLIEDIDLEKMNELIKDAKKSK